MVHYIYDHGEITKRYIPNTLENICLPDGIIRIDNDSALHLYLSYMDDKKARKLFVEHFKMHYKAAKHTPIFWVKEVK